MKDFSLVTIFVEGSFFQKLYPALANLLQIGIYFGVLVFKRGFVFLGILQIAGVDVAKNIWLLNLDWIIGTRTIRSLSAEQISRFQQYDYCYKCNGRANKNSTDHTHIVLDKHDMETEVFI